MKQSLDDKCERVMRKVIRKRKRTLPSTNHATPDKQGRVSFFFAFSQTTFVLIGTPVLHFQELRIAMDNGFEIEDVTGRPEDADDASLSAIDENDYIDVVGDTQEIV